MSEHDLMTLPSDFLRLKSAFRYTSSLKQSLRSAFLCPLVCLGLQGALLSALDFSLPLYIIYIEDYIEENRGIAEGVASIAVIVSTMIVKGIVQARQTMQMSRLKTNVKTAVLELVFDTALGMRDGVSVGQAVNVMQVDAAKIHETVQWAVSLCYYPFHFLAAVALLWRLMGVAALMGVLFFILLFTFNYFVEKTIHRLNLEIMKLKDNRMKVTSELLSNIRPLKFANWEDALADRVIQSRQIEGAKLRTYMKLRAISICSLWASSVIVAIAMFLFYVHLFGHELTISVAFGTTSTLFLLQIPLREIPSSAFLHTEKAQPPISGSRSAPITLESASFAYSQTGAEVIHDLTFACEKGAFVGVIGSVGSGKTSLLRAILGEMCLKSGSCEVNGSISFCGSIDSWILNSTVRDNITIGREFNEKRYKAVLDVCALTQDLEALPAYDLTEIGERGINLSGGQKARVALARGVYADSDVYLLDDPLGAVDAHVRKHIFQHCFQSFLRGKTRVLVTHSLELLSSVDQVLTLSAGHLTHIGRPSDVSVLPILIETDGKEVESGGQLAVLSSGRLIKDEERGHGSVSWPLYKAYISLGGGVVVVVFMVFFVSGWILAKIASDIALKMWAEKDPGMWEAWFVILSGVSVVCIFYRVYILAVCGVNASIKIHDQAVRAVVRAPINLYYDVTPLGRLLNRFSKDLYDMDQQLPFNFGSVLTSYAALLGVVLISSLYVPLILLIVPGLYYIAHRCQVYYLAGSNNINRMLRNANSPILQHFAESLAGLKVIRSLGLGELSRKTNKDYIEASNRIMFNEAAANIWLNLMLNGVSVVYFAGIVGFLVIAHSHFSSGAIGLIITYMLPLPRAINNNTLFLSLMRTNMISMERVHQLTM